MTDQHIRDIAIDPTQSFIVQAPAGSGKTSLLVQRYLACLAQCDSPEQVIAITFTRKAAHEMRERIMHSLKSSLHIAPSNAHEKVTQGLVKHVLKKNDELQWQLLSQPQQCRILTIDALNAWLIKQAPLCASINYHYQINPQPHNDYQEAARRLFGDQAHSEQHKQAREHLLAHLDHRAQHAQNLLVTMLASRDQWLPYLLQQDNEALRCQLEKNLMSWVAHRCQCAADHLPQNLGEYIAFDTDAPSADPSTLPAWQKLATQLLTQKGQWRKIWEKNKNLSLNEAFRTALNNMLSCPNPHYSEHAWTMIDALICLLPWLVAHLHLIFKTEQRIDYIEQAIMAQNTLNKNQTGNICYEIFKHIHHLLIDEFQDTSLMQYRLISALIQDWPIENSGQQTRSLFCVGDPMQSIYRFRQADVSLFLRAEKNGIAHIPLINLTLTRNFRSQKSIIDWVNQVFSHLLPKKADITQGVMPYTSSVSVKPALPEPSVCAFVYDKNDPILEAEMITRRIDTYLIKNPLDSVGILVRSRTHLKTILPALKQANIACQTHGIKPLMSAPIVNDLLTLTRAIHHQDDLPAIFSLLRTPFIGISLPDCEKISILCSTQYWLTLPVDTLSAEGQIRFKTCQNIVLRALQWRSQYNLYQTIKRTWSAIAGAHALTESGDAVDLFFKTLSDWSTNDDTLDIKNLIDLCEASYIDENNPEARCHIMTIHGAKGLEFDHVILPALHKKSPNNKHELLCWHEQWDNNHTQLLLSSLPSSQEPNNALYNLIRTLEKEKVAHEQKRLLYVAVTRAKKYLSLYAGVDTRYPEKNDSRSFLHFLWPQFLPLVKDMEPKPTIHDSQSYQNRTYTRWPQACLESIAPKPHETQVVAIHTSQPTATLLGQLIHKQLQHHKNEDKTEWLSTNINRLRQKISQQAQQLGADATQITRLVDKTIEAMQNTCQDARGQWLFATDHAEVMCEQPIHLIHQKQQHTIIIDRSFVDASNKRWIIDFKTHHDDNLPQQKRRHHAQLACYAAAMQQIDPRPIELALYFPLTGGWVHWSYTATKEDHAWLTNPTT